MGSFLTNAPRTQRKAPRKPRLHFAYLSGCGVCHEVKPELDKVVAELRGLVSFTSTDLEKGKAPYPVTIFPALHLTMPDGTEYHTDASMRTLTKAHLIAGWLDSCVSDWRSRR